MEKIKFNLENCYGINKLSHEFDFSQSNGSVIYAPNGTMKTSFAKTFKDISEEKEPKERIYNRIPVFNIDKFTLCNWEKINANDIYVVEHYNETFNFNKISKLLVNPSLKKKYVEINENIEKQKQKIIRKLNSLSGVKKADIEQKMINDFEEKDKDFLEILASLKEKVIEVNPINVKDLKYIDLFNQKVMEIMNEKEIKNRVEEYSNKLSEILEESKIFERNFTHNNAEKIKNELEKNGFFKAKHQIKLKTGKVIKNQGELEEIINKEIDDIISDDGLSKIFKKIDESFEQNQTTRNFKEILEKYPQIIIPGFNNVKQFKITVWISILSELLSDYENLVEIYKNGKTQIEEIIREAKSNESSWKDIVNLFNDRFLLPFELEITNMEDMILKDVEIPAINFIYKDGNNRKKLKQNELIEYLSTGERRALYLLNVIYEIESRKVDENPVLIILDDIADSFDYQNKYAIIEYLEDTLNENFFKLIILTHNFDFYRTVSFRLDIGRQNVFMVNRNGSELQIVPGQYIRNVFAQWKGKINDKTGCDNRILIASIAFLRNLIEYKDGKNDCYNLLTSLLHYKDDTEDIKIKDIKQVYSKIWDVTIKIDGNIKIFDLINDEAKKILDDILQDTNLEAKITLSIAIRMCAEKYMKNKIEDKEKINNIKSNQTKELYNQLKVENKENSLLSTLSKVNLMTPENIHLNSFMYEPILDMDDDYLKKLYKKITEKLNV
jgi:ABC-type lipoprotein export system ATPase subunit